MNRADETINALRSGHEDLATLARGFTADDLAQPSGASEWDVSQVLSHLGSGAEINLACLNGALDGTGLPESGFNESVWARWDAMPREERAERFVEVHEALVSRYEGLDAAARQDLRVEIGFIPGPLDVAFVGGVRLGELAHHTWDVKVAFDPAAALAPEATPLLLDQVPTLIGFLAKPAELDGRPVTLEVRTTAPERSFGLVIDDAVTITETPGDPDAVLTTPAEWLLRLLVGRHAHEHTPSGVTVTGARLTLDDLRRVFPGL